METIENKETGVEKPEPSKSENSSTETNDVVSQIKNVSSDFLSQAMGILNEMKSLASKKDEPIDEQDDETLENKLLGKK